MPLLFFLAGIILVVTGVNGTLVEAGNLLKRDFTGPGNFFAWLFAIVAAGSIGYIPTLRPLSYAFLALVFVGILLTSGSGFFSRLQEAIADLNKSGIQTASSSEDFFDIDGFNLGESLDKGASIFEKYGDFAYEGNGHADQQASSQSI